MFVPFYADHMSLLNLGFFNRSIAAPLTLDDGISPEWHEMRTALAKHLEETQGLIQQSLSDIDLDGFLANFSEKIKLDDGDARYRYALIVRKIGFHVAALLLANLQNNVHSAGVHARVLVECAAEIVPVGNAAGKGMSEEAKRILNAQEYDSMYLLLQMSGGRITREELEARIKEAREAIGISNGKPPTKVSLTDRVAALTEGKQWYTYLSDSFCHTDVISLRNVPGLGGILPASAIQQHVALITIMNCAMTYIGQSLMAFGIIRITEGDESRYFDDALALLERARETTAPFRENLTLARRNVTDGEQA